MAHTARNKKKLVDRIKRIRGQLNAVEDALEHDRECGEVLLTLAACRGALNALMAEILEGHVRHHVFPGNAKPNAAAAQAVEEVVEVLRRYLK